MNEHVNEEEAQARFEKGLLIRKQGGSIKEVCDAIGKSKSTWYRWRNMFRHGQITLPPQSMEYLAVIEKQREKILRLEEHLAFVQRKLDNEQSKSIIDHIKDWFKGLF